MIEEKKRIEKAIFVLEHTSLRCGGKARKEENTNINRNHSSNRISFKP
jgi:hypothetical protein